MYILMTYTQIHRHAHIYICTDSCHTHYTCKHIYTHVHTHNTEIHRHTHVCAHIYDTHMHIHTQN